MSRIQSPNKTRIGLIAVALVGGINFASTAFSAAALPQGYQLASSEKTSEGKCGDASFARTDADHDARVSLKELLAVAPKGADEFKAIDANGDGFLSEGEVYTFRTHQFTANGKKVPNELFTRLSQAKD
jgi:uncharacterized low-complexity protein